MKKQIMPMHVFVGCVSWLGMMIIAFAPIFGFEFKVSTITAILTCVIGFLFGWAGQFYPFDKEERHKL